MRLLPLIVGTLALVLTAPGADESAASLYKQARKAHEKGDDTNAYLLSSKAVSLDPQRLDYWQFSQAVRTRGLAGLKIAIPSSSPQDGFDNSHPISETDLREATETLPPPVLKGDPALRDFNLRGDARRLFEDVAKAYGLQVVFDSDYQPGPAIQFRLDGATWRDALRSLESVTSSFLVPISERVALVAKDTTQKRAELEPVMTVLIPFDEPLTPQEVQEAARAVQSAFDMTKMGIDNGRRIVLFRDRVSRLRPAMDLFQQLMVHRAQVTTEVELLAITDTSTLNYGFDLQSAFPIVWLGNPTPFATPLAVPSGFPPYAPTIGGGKSQFAIGLSSNSVFANLTKGKAQSLIRTEIRGIDGQPAQLHVGDRYPVLTAGYFGTVQTPGQVYAPPPTVNFEDLGIVLKITPRVHSTEEVSLELEAEFKSLSGQTNNGIPVISNRKFVTRVRSTFSQTTVIAGFVRETLSQSWSGIPVLVKIPALRNNSKSTEYTQLLLTLRPRLMSLPPSEVATLPIRAGSESRPLTPLD